MLVAVLTNNSALLETVKMFSQLSDSDSIVHFRTMVDLIRHLISRTAVDAVIVDADADPSLGTLGLLSSWRSSHSRSDFTVVVIGHFIQEHTMSRAFEMGADDIVVGPVNVVELYTRVTRCVQALRSIPAEAAEIEIGDYCLQQRSLQITYRGEPIRLTAREFAICWLFFSSPGTLLTRARIAVEIWGAAADQVGRTLEQHIYKLRRKLHLDGRGGIEIEAVYSSGYRLHEVSNTSPGTEHATHTPG